MESSTVQKGKRFIEQDEGFLDNGIILHADAPCSSGPPPNLCNLPTKPTTHEICALFERPSFVVSKTGDVRLQKLTKLRQDPASWIESLKIAVKIDVRSCEFLPVVRGEFEDE